MSLKDVLLNAGVDYIDTENEVWIAEDVIRCENCSKILAKDSEDYANNYTDNWMRPDFPEVIVDGITLVFCSISCLKSFVKEMK